jgi:hypothetical protein
VHWGRHCCESCSGGFLLGDPFGLPHSACTKAQPVIIFQVELDKNISILKDKEKELEKHIERLSEQQPFDVDEAVTTTAPLYKQYVTPQPITVTLAEVY